jgi:hypothetical protein
MKKKKGADNIKSLSDLICYVLHDLSKAEDIPVNQWLELKMMFKLGDDNILADEVMLKKVKANE